MRFKVSLCIQCLNAIKCRIPSFCSSKIGVKKLSAKSATFDDVENKDYENTMNECQFVIPESLEVEVRQGIYVARKY